MRLRPLVNPNRGKSTVETGVEGSDHYMKGGNVTDCPYVAGTPQFDTWMDGWNKNAWADLGARPPTIAGTGGPLVIAGAAVGATGAAVGATGATGATGAASTLDVTGSLT